jgi:hypothetical protein
LTAWRILHQQVFLKTNLGQLSNGEYTGELITDMNKSSHIQKFEILSKHVYREWENWFDEKT